MPRIVRRSRLKASELTDGQLAALQFGPMLPDVFGKGFDSEAEECGAWRKRKATLMANHDAGVRPYAFFKYDLGIEPRRTFDMLQALLAHGLIEPAEAVQLEKQHPWLNPQDTTCCSSFETIQSVRAMNPGPRTDAGDYSLASLARQFDVCAAFHRFRNRAEMAERYARLAATVREALKGGSK